MSWIEKLFRTYEGNVARIGDRSEAQPLEPVCHTTQNAQVTIVITGNGDFVRCAVVPKPEAKTLVPATEGSAGRSGTRPVSHPLCDKLQYVAGDFVDFGGEVTSGYSRDPKGPHRDYVRQLSEWCDSPYGHPKVRAILAYVMKRSVVADLVRAGLLHVESDDDRPKKRTLMNRWPDRDNVPEVFRLLPGGADPKGRKRPCQADAFVRWSIEIPGEPQSAVWTDAAIHQSWVGYYGGIKATKGLCYVTGEQQFMADHHPAKIRSGADKAKLISSDDKTGYTFRGRFTTAGEACGVGFEVTQKAHNALRWLLARQGYRDGDQAVVAWAVSGVDVPHPCANTLALLFDEAAEESSPAGGYTAQEIGVQLSKRIAGYSATLGATDEVMVMGLDSATPGRMAISFYRELTGSELLSRIQAWHEGCCWLQRFGKGKVFVGAPAPRDIAEAAYGRRLDDKLRKTTIERLLPCIVDGAPIPRDLVESCVRRVSNRYGLEAWEWEKALGIACALYRYQHQERSYSMALDRNRNTRDYLYGRLLALAEHLESRALYAAGEKRETNAGRLMQRFAERPYATWLTLETSLAPYRTRLQTKRPASLHHLQTEIDEVMSKFATADFISDHRLSGEFLLSYHCQRAALWTRAVNGHDETGQADDDAEAEA